MASICCQKLMIKRADTARGAPADQLSRCVEPIARPNSRPPTRALSLTLHSVRFIGTCRSLHLQVSPSSPLPFPIPIFPSPLCRSSVTHVKVGPLLWRRLLSNRPSILGQFDARPPAFASGQTRHRKCRKALTQNIAIILRFALRSHERELK